MSSTDSRFVNVTSLKLVHDELLASIEQAAAKLEQFAADRNDAALLQECIDGIAQISGTLNLIQLHGADLLASELQLLINEMTVGESGDDDKRLGTLTNTFFILPRYLEYVTHSGIGLPALLMPYINELRVLRKEARLSEGHFFAINLEAQRATQGQGGAVLGEDFPAFVRRFRHMYQVALVNVLQGKQVKTSLGMMARAMQRLDSISAERPLSKLWWLAGLAFADMSEAGIEITQPRKLLFGALDREVKSLQKDTGYLDSAPQDTLVHDLVYLMALSATDNAASHDALNLFAQTPLGYTDKLLRAEREALKGPSANTMSSMAQVLKDELRIGKDILERASQGGNLSPEEHAELAEVLNKVSDILMVVGLTTPGASLKTEVEKIKDWAAGNAQPEQEELIEVADSLIYVESTVSGLEKMQLSDDKLAEANALARHEVIAQSQLQEAEAVVLDEAEAGLALIKRALSSFSESDYDRGHIKNVAATLNAVRGGMMVLNLPRAASVVGTAAAFVDEQLLHSDQPAALKQMLETFADAVISLEYYLDAIKTDRKVDDKVLEIAEESLEALGYSAS